MNIPRLTRFRNSEFIAFISDVIELTRQTNFAPLAAPFADLETAYANLDMAFKIVQGNLLTQSVQELDAGRDLAIRGIKAITKAYHLHYKETYRLAAAAILQELNKYDRSIHTLSYQAQTATTDSLIKDFDASADLTAALALLHLTEWKAELALLNQAFSQKYLERVQDEAEKEQEPVRALRPAAITAYESLVRHIEAHHLLTPSDSLKSLIAQLNELIKKYN
ncbi:MAG: DUF6261 family protein [Chitinophagales bacterium]